MYTPEFERWWAKATDENIALIGSIPYHLAQVKHLVWLAWRTGREKLHEELQHTQLQRQRA